jgi:3-phenylpropionate/cinnamic acid dioxygenase small subunit
MARPANAPDVVDDAREIENLLYAYAERIDAGDLTGVAELFRHGRLEAAPGVVFEGTDEVRSMYDAATRLYDDGTPRTRHVTTNVAVEVDRTTGTATSRAYYTVYQQTDELPLQVIIAGRYHDSFHRIDGEWCFEVREMFVDLTGDLSHHLLFDL